MPSWRSLRTFSCAAAAWSAAFFFQLSSAVSSSTGAQSSIGLGGAASSSVAVMAGAVVPARRYAVTGDRELTTVLTVHDDGKWELAKGTLYDVTHLPCRAAKYTNGSPANARASDFPVTPGGAMPPVSGCQKQDYAVVFVTAVAQ